MPDPTSPRVTRLRRNITSRIVRTIRVHRLIEPGDRILAAISGGKDSVAMLDLLVHLQKRRDFDFEVEAVHVRTEEVCGDCDGCDALESWIKGLGVPWHQPKSILAESDPHGDATITCYRCSRARRKLIFELAGTLGIRKVALGHHHDDLAQTALLNLLCHAECTTMTARQDLFGGAITLIRPLADVEERRCVDLVHWAGYPVSHCDCPAEKTNPRAVMRELLDQASRFDRQARRNLVKAALAHTPQDKTV